MNKSKFGILFLVAIFLGIFSGSNVYAACASFIKWQADAGTSNWNTKTNWNPSNIPNSNNESALIVADWYFTEYPNSSFSLSCFEIQSGRLSSNRARTLTIQGDYFRNPIAGSLIVSNTSWTIAMAGSTTQEFYNVDDIPRLTISNPSTVNIKGSFAITNTFSISAGAGIINVENSLESTSAFTIPSTATFTIKSGATLKALGGITVNGVLKVEAGAILEIGNGSALTIASGGLLQLAGAPGNIASVKANNSGSYSFTVAGSLNANNFSISRTVAAGVNLSGNLQQLNNGDFHNIANNGYAMTWGAVAIVPSTINNVGFFDEGATGTQRNINATNYNLSTVTVNQWSGIGGTLNETDPNNKITWSTQDSAKLKLSNRTTANIPASTIGTSSVDTLFMTYGFSMTSTAPTATDITSIVFTIAGSNNSSDVNYIKIYKDTNANCIYNVGTDTLIGSALVPTGAPATTTLNIGAGNISVIDTTEKCIHVLLSTSATAQNGNSLAISIAGTSDVTNSQNYDWATSGAPPLQGGLTTINGVATRIWHGGNGSPTNGGVFTQANNWLANGAPTSALDCQIGPGYSFALFSNTTEQSCRNATLPANGQLSWGSNLATTFSFYGSLTIGSPYNFTNANNATFAFKGNTNQSINAATNFPGNLLIANTGATVSLNSSWSIGGNFTQSSGTFIITSGTTFTVAGNININGGTFKIEPGATLILGNNSVLTVALGATLDIVGLASQSTVLTTALNTQSFTVVINGTIKARYYSFSRLGTTGVTINSGATIDATNYLQNGSFTYPVNNNSTLLRLNRKIPGNNLSFITFDKAGSSATSVTNILTNTTAGTLTISDYNGDVSGESFDNDPTYIVNWSSPTNTLNITQEATSSGNLNQGNSYIIGRFGFKQTQAGSFNNTNITSIAFTLFGSGDANDVSSLKAYYDSDCNNVGGTLIGSGSFTGNPAKVTLSNLSGVLIESHPSAPPLRCIYVELIMDSLATAGETIGVKINSTADVLNSEDYLFNGAYSPPVDLGVERPIIGTTAVWTGASSTAWNTAGNWNGGTPTSSMNCIINAATRNPLINATTANCKSLTIGNGTLTMSGGATLNIYGGFENTGTFNQGGQTLMIRDNGVNATNQTISSNSEIQSLAFNKTAAGGSVSVESTNLAVTNLLNLTSGNNFEFRIPDGKTLRVNAGVTISAGTFTIEGGGTLDVASAQSVTVNGGTFKMNGVNEAQPGADPQNSYYSLYASKKAILKPVSGTFSFNSTSGNIYMNGFVVAGLDTNGFRVGGTTSLNKLDGGQFAGLSTNFSSMKAIQLNTTGSLPVSANKIGFNWETSAGTESNTPASSAAYLLAFSSGCANQTIDFTEWYGDWYEEVANFSVNTKKSNTNCTINFGGSSSAVSLLQFEATPYDSKIELNWSTIFEQNHTGFNIYRSNSNGENFIKINSSLIRNTLSSITFKGKYHYSDENVENGTTYFYYIQDVDQFGSGQLHGPKLATPLALYGIPPLPDQGSNSGGTNDEGGTTNGSNSSKIKNSTFKDLGGGIEILSQTSTHIRIKIVPLKANFSSSAWDKNFEKVSMDSYGQTEAPGLPELLKRQILIEVNPAIENYQIIKEQLSSSSLGAKKIQPAPLYFLNENNVLEAHYHLNTNAYNSSDFTPNHFYHIGKNLQKVADKKYLAIDVYPLKYNAFTEEILRLDQVIFDIALNGQSWEIQLPSDSNYFSPSIIANTLKIDYKQKGMLELNYTDLIDTDTDAPFSNANLEELRLYKGSDEIPLFIEDQNNDGAFNNQDKIFFYTNFKESNFDLKNQVILANRNLFNSPEDPKRYFEINGEIITSREEKDPDILQNLKIEQDSDILLYESLGDNEDHFIWKLLRSITGYDSLSMNANLSNINTASLDDVKLTLKLKGQELEFGDSEYQHHLGIYLNGDKIPTKELFFSSKKIQSLSFTLPHHKFIAGKNEIIVRVIGSDAASMGQIDKIAIDSLEIEYYAHKSASQNDLLEFDNDDPNAIITLHHFSSSNIDLWDLSDLEAPAIVINTNIATKNDGGSYDLHFESNDGDGESAQHYLALTHDKYIKPSALSLSEGNRNPLKSTDNEAHLIIMGEKFLTDAAQDLVNKRQAEGLKTKVVNLEQIYAEFSNGIISAKAIKDFIIYAKSHWSIKPKYLLILGDGNFDMTKKLSSSTTQKGDIPMVLEGARFIDYATDNYFVSNSNNSTPQLAVGRIPTNSVEELRKYIQKQIDYENGQRMPNSGLRKISFVVGEEINSNDPNEDQFADRIAELTSLNSNFTKETINWHNLGGNTPTKLAVLNKFKIDTPFMLTYMGHGAPNLWGSLSFILNSDMEKLINQNLPIVMSLNCDNAFFYDSVKNSTTRTIGESLMLNSSGGAIAFIGSSTQTTPAAQTYFAKAFYNKMGEHLALPYHRLGLGDILLEAKLSLANDAYSKDIMKSSMLFGDPSMPIEKSLFNSKAETKNSEEKIAGGCTLSQIKDKEPLDFFWGILQIAFLILLYHQSNRLIRKF